MKTTGQNDKFLRQGFSLLASQLQWKYECHNILIKYTDGILCLKIITFTVIVMALYDRYLEIL